MQARWLLTGALDWARLVLREDGRIGGTDHLAEPWAVPLNEARLSSFLAASKADTDTSDIAQTSFLSGQITDLQARLNVSSLMEGEQVSLPVLRAFTRLYALLGLPEAELTALVRKLRTGANTAAPAVSRMGNALAPRTVAQLEWLGLSRHSLEILEPYITVLPVATPVNLNTASAEVLHACIDGLSMADAQKLVRARVQSHFRTLEDVAKLLGPGAEPRVPSRHSLDTHFFEVQARLRMDNITVQERTVVQRERNRVTPLSRSWGTLGPAGLSTMVSPASSP